MDDWNIFKDINYNVQCPWYILDYSHKALLGACTIVFGFTGVVLNCWMIAAFVQSHLLSFRSHLLVLNLSTACLARGILGGFPFSGSSAINGKWLFGSSCCQLFAFFNQLLGVFEVTALTALCFERYLLARRTRYGKELGLKFYIFCIVVCWVYSLAFSIPPLLQYGTYGCDVSGTTCSLDWRFRNKRQAAFNIPLVLFAGVLPTIIIIVSLWKAVNINRRIRVSEMEWEQWSLTKNAVCLSFFILLLWSPQAILSSWLWTGGCCDGQHKSLWLPPPALALFASLGSEASAMVPFLCYLAGEPRIRTALLGRCKKDYGIIRGVNKFQGFRRINQ